ncbi:hypothetical protein ACN263_08625 [Micromonospora sp. WMMD729]|uniref:hypothetical protein n=1 Tax=Micromonospora sp. WMMD729 TaxID=3404127 RepID=UPI003BF503D1
MKQGQELERLRERVRQLEASLLGARRELFDVRGRLAAIARMTDDLERVQRAPGVIFGMVNSIIHSQSSTLRRSGRWSPVRYHGNQQ